MFGHFGKFGSCCSRFPTCSLKQNPVRQHTGGQYPFGYKLNVMGWTLTLAQGLIGSCPWSPKPNNLSHSFSENCGWMKEKYLHSIIWFVSVIYGHRYWGKHARARACIQLARTTFIYNATKAGFLRRGEAQWRLASSADPSAQFCEYASNTKLIIFLTIPGHQDPDFNSHQLNHIK